MTESGSLHVTEPAPDPTSEDRGTVLITGTSPGIGPAAVIAVAFYLRKGFRSTDTEHDGELVGGVVLSYQPTVASGATAEAACAGVPSSNLSALSLPTLTCGACPPGPGL